MTTLPLSEVKARLSEIAEEVAATHERVQITKNGRDYVVLLAARQYASESAGTLTQAAGPSHVQAPTQACASAALSERALPSASLVPETSPPFRKENP